MAVTINGTPTVSAADRSNTDPIDETHTVPSLTDGAIFVAVVGNGTGVPSVSAVTWDVLGVAEDVPSLGTSVTQGGIRISLFGLANPTAGASKTLRVDLSAGYNSGCRVCIVNLEGVDQNTPFFAYATASATSGDPTVDLAAAIATGEISLDAIWKISNAGASIAPDGSQIEIDSGVNAALFGFSSLEGDGSTPTMSWTRSGGTSDAAWAQAAVGVNAAASGIIVNPLLGPLAPIGYVA